MIIVGGASIFIEMDFTAPAFGAAPTWTDVTSYVLTSPQTPGSSEVTGSWGRQDWMGDVTAGSMSLTFINDGRFTPGNASSPYYPNVKYGVRAQIRFVISGVTVVVAGGFATDWTATPANGTYWTTTVNFTDIYGLFSNSTELRGYLTEESFENSPMFLFPLQEDEGSLSFGDITGNYPPVTISNSKFGAGVVDAGQTASGSFIAGDVVSITNPYGVFNSPGSWLTFPTVTVAGSATFEAWVTFGVNPASPVDFLTDGSGRLNGLLISMFSNFVEVDVNNTGVFSGKNPADGLLHHLAIVLDYTAHTKTIYIDGVIALDVTGVGVHTLTGTGLGTVQFNVAGFANPAPASSEQWSGQVSYVGLWPSALSGTRILANYNAGADAFQGVDRTDQHVARLLSYRTNYGSVLDVGLGYTGSEDITGETMQSALSSTSAAEGGVLYADGLQRIVMRSRAVTFNPVPVLTVDVSQGQLDVPTTFRDDVQNVVNDLTVTRANGADQRAFNAASIAQVGDYTQSITANVDTDGHALDLAAWGVAVGTIDQTSSPTLTFDLYALLARGNTALVLQLLQVRPLDVVKTINNLPQAPASTMQMVVQGGSFTISSEAISLELYTTPLPPNVLTSDGLVNGVSVAADTSDSATYVAAY